MSLLDRTLRAGFSHDGAFRVARATGPGSADLEPMMPEVLDTLEEYGSPAPPPGT